MFKEFKTFISKGNVIDLAVGLILATYFGAIVQSFVDDIIMPPIGKLVSGVDFKSLEYVISEGAVDANTGEIVGYVSIAYGLFFNTIITFIIVSFSVFMVVKSYNKVKRKKAKIQESTPPQPTREEVLLEEIRDLLKK